ncbi:monooxygenase [Trichoderma evansii]
MSEIIIVGAGPTGLWLALELRTAGLGVTVIERNRDRDIRSHAIAMSAGSLETFATRGMAQRFINAGIPLHSVHFGSSESRLQMSRETLGIKHPHSLMIPQAVTEQLLVELCQEKGVKFFFGHLAIGLVQDGETVTVEIETENGLRSTFTASWLVGCDGTKTDALVTDPPSNPISVNNESGSFLMQPLGYQKYYRLAGVNIGTMDFPPSAIPTLENFKSFAFEALGTDFGIDSPLWISRYSITTRLATNFRSGRVFIAGDAAHQFFPAGGQEITTGLQDAANLAWKLAAVTQKRLTGKKGDELLNSYSTERRLALQAIIKSTLAQTALYASSNPVQSALADVVYELITHPDLNKLWVRRITGFDDPFPKVEASQDPLIGSRVTHLEVGGGFEPLHGAMALLLYDCISPWAAHIKYFGPNDDIISFGKQWDGVGAALVRPDARVAWVCRASFPREQIKSAITELLGNQYKEI